jgi:hypothetical protein
MSKVGETEVFRITPDIGKCYMHAEHTRQSGSYPKERYFSNSKPNYVGQCIGTFRDGYGDGANSWSIFNDNGIENRVDYSYEGKTSFIEVPCQEPTEKNKKRKQSALNELKVMPSFGKFPGGIHFQEGQTRWNSMKGGHKTSKLTKNVKALKTRKRQLK